MKNELVLIRLAAKAAGMDVTPYTWDKGTGWDHEGFVIAGAGGEEWNPWEDDGDALRLAVKLGLKVEPWDVGLAVSVAGNWRAKCAEKNKGDPCASTRRAIVRAAAEIGREIGRFALKESAQAEGLSDEDIHAIWHDAVEGLGLRQIEPHHVSRFARAIIARITGEGEANV